MKFDIHESDVNAVRFFPSGEALGTACSDGTVSTVIMSVYLLVCNSIHTSIHTMVYNSMQEYAVNKGD